MGVPAFGTNNQFSATGVLTNDALGGMGDYLTQEVGSLNWIEGRVMAQLMETGFNFLQLMSEQIQPASASVYLSRWAQIYNLQGLSSVSLIQEQVQTIQSLTGTAPTFSNIQYYLQQVLGACYLGLQWAPENQGNATIDPYTTMILDGYEYQMPLATLFVYLWQPRDNQDNLLMSNAQFSEVLQSYQQILDIWLPHFSQIETLLLLNRGNQDGYGGGYNGLNYNNYLDGYNVVSGTAGNKGLTGTNTTFESDFFPQLGSEVIPFSINRNPPIQIVDDTGMVQTYYVASVNSNTSITLTSPLINNITNRTYRTLGIVFDTPGMLDFALFNH